MCDVTRLKLHKRCKTPTEGIAVSVQKDGVEIPICHSCWKRIGNGDWEVGEDPKPTTEQIFGRRAKEEQEATVTEYRLKDKKSAVQNISEEEDVE